MAKKGLGRGFSSLIPTEMIIDEKIDSELGLEYDKSQLKELKISDISPDPEQPRRHFNKEKLEELVNSIRIHGVLQPIVVVRKNSKFLIVAGERRYRASKLAGLERVPAVVRELSDQNRLELSLIENIQRDNLNVLEMAEAYLKLREQFNLTAKEIGERVGGRSESAVLNTLRLLKLPQIVKDYIISGKLKEGQARPLLKIDEETIKKILPKIIEENWSSRKIEQFLVNYKKQIEESKKVEPKKVNNPFEKTVKHISKKLSADVDIKTSARGSGKIVIKFKSEEELKRLEKILSK
ncbi:MAG: ParB/RepB/Spo0J family partition protein [Candidatus Saccharimonas sp.]|nr:MAG: ParB/RepB/Spo0J family partition protein [Candidatus Saccharimonas sp.]